MKLGAIVKVTQPGVFAGRLGEVAANDSGSVLLLRLLDYGVYYKLGANEVEEVGPLAQIADAARKFYLA